MRILALDAALARCSAAVVVDGDVAALRQAVGGRGQAATLPVMVRAVLSQAGLKAGALDGVAVTVGPGSFTGLRAAIALAQGVALASGRPVVGVTVAEALADRLRMSLRGRALWVAIDSRRGRIFLQRGIEPASAILPIALDALPQTDGPVAVAGDAAVEVSARLAARGDNVMLTDARLPEALHVAAVGARRLRGEIASCPAQPIYVDPPEAKLPAGGLRPAPDSLLG
jgi:tRNA threonylcarbamoyladenosine biosynthesis protein TsaB